MNERKKENGMKVSISFIIVILICAILDMESVHAEEAQDYIIGRPLTEEEIENQKALEPELFDNYIEDFEIEASTIQPYTVLPERYDARERGVVPKVKNQGMWSCCWAVATTLNAEVSTAAWQGGMVNLDYSEGHLAYFFYNRINDPLQNTLNDRNVLPDGTHYLNNGGNTMLAAQALATGSGFADEEEMPFQPYSDMLEPSKEIAYQNSAVLKDAFFLSKNQDELKKAIYEYGSVSISYYHDNTYYNFDTAAYSDLIGGSTNHSVVIVGWDDTYSKHNFLSSSGVTANGAWIVQNSWGNGWGDQGCFYLSYECLSINSPVLFITEDTDEYDYNYQYDGTAGASYVTLNNYSKISNIYQIKGDSFSGVEIVKAIGITLFDPDIWYSVQIYTNLTDTSNPESGEAAFSQPLEGRTTAAGVLTLPLEEKVYLNQGEDYAVVLELANMNAETVRVGMEASRDYGWVSFQAGIEKEQSFRNLNGHTWKDLADNGLCARLKVYTSDANIQVDSLELDHERVTLGIEKEITLTASIIPEDIATEHIKWETDDKTVAEVENGVVKAVGYGVCKISASIGDKETTCQIQVIPNSPTNISAKGSGKNKVLLTWEKSDDAEGYLIYAQKSGKYAYCGMTSKATTTSFTDTKALDLDYNFYWVFPYVKNSVGKMIPGTCQKYVYAKGTCSAVTNLKAASVHNGVKLTWTKSAGAEGYLVYGIRPGGKYSYIGMTTTGTTFTDKKASKKEYNFYWVYPYHKNTSGKMVVGGTAKYVYGRAK